MGENVVQNPALYPQLEQRLREQLNEACRLARELDEWLRSIPEGRLMEVTSGEAAMAPMSSRRSSSLAMAAAEVVGAFNEGVKLLLQSSSDNVRHGNIVPVGELSPTFSTATASPRQQALGPSCSPSTQLAGVAAPPPVSGLTPMKSQPLSLPLRNTNAAKQAKMSSPPSLRVHSPLQLSATTTSDMSEGSPHPRPAAASAAPLSSSADEATTPFAANPAVRAVLGRKRKLLPKVTLKMAAASVESAESNTPPDDGHTWRKYGQKIIHGALHPRGYYRCTHCKTDIGCPAVKQVQRCDEEQMFFDVIYKGYHTCRSAELDKEYWPLAFPQGLSNLFNFASNSSSLLPASLINFSHPMTTVAASLIMEDGPALPSTQALPKASSTTLSLVSSGLHQLMNTDIISTSLDTTLQQHAQEQCRVLNPLEDWSNIEHNSRPEMPSKRPFMKASQYGSAIVNETHPQLLLVNERQQQSLATERRHSLLANEGQLLHAVNERQHNPHLYGSLIGSKPTGSSTLHMNAITSHEQTDATIINASSSPNIGIALAQSPSQQEHHLGIAGSTLAFDDDMDNDNLFSDYFKHLN
ncbi:hypothetical protein GOP47_0025943 [Adiantum capillus-veneris]|uniref:WRKY domain-containing protein n=1 Tax=Adiantum capillus-veneris TaxID=13818 RepID=A0A9D4U378_ADICA|nr:hypothetical protein GOP47_0025943 [Adiantum capillus-veneris]